MKQAIKDIIKQKEVIDSNTVTLVLFKEDWSKLWGRLIDIINMSEENVTIPVESIQEVMGLFYRTFWEDSELRRQIIDIVRGGCIELAKGDKHNFSFEIKYSIVFDKPPSKPFTYKLIKKRGKPDYVLFSSDIFYEVFFNNLLNHPDYFNVISDITTLRDFAVETFNNYIAFAKLTVKERDKKFSDYTKGNIIGYILVSFGYYKNKASYFESYGSIKGYSKFLHNCVKYGLEKASKRKSTKR